MDIPLNVNDRHEKGEKVNTWSKTKCLLLFLIIPLQSRGQALRDVLGISFHWNHDDLACSKFQPWKKTPYKIAGFSWPSFIRYETLPCYKSLQNSCLSYPYGFHYWLHMTTQYFAYKEPNCCSSIT